MSKIKTGRNDTKSDVICRHAARLFKEKGYTAASVRDIADSLGIEAPSLYNHIGSKAELLQSICFRVAEMYYDQLLTIKKSALPAPKKLEKVMRFHIKIMLQSYDEVYVANYEWRRLDDDNKAKFLQLRKDYEFQLVQIFKEGIHAKQLRRTNPHVAVLTILTALRGVEFIHKYKGQISNRVLENNIIHLLLKGIIVPS